MGNTARPMRLLLTVSYDGTNYVGWQFQENGPSIQQALEEALEKALGRFCRVTGASRTDAGVHALGQRAHVDVCASIPPEKYSFVLNTMLPPEKYPFVLNRYLPEDIRVTETRQVADDFHARFMAAGKMYTYRIHNAPHASAILRNCTAHVPVTLDIEAMRQCAKALIGTHDFAAFAAAGGQAKTTVRTIDFFDIARNGEEITLRVHGNGFLYNMVRIIAGTLIDVGHGRLDVGCMARAIESKNRLDLGVTAPACGLELTRVEYDFEREEGSHA